MPKTTELLSVYFLETLSLQMVNECLHVCVCACVCVCVCGCGGVCVCVLQVVRCCSCLGLVRRMLASMFARQPTQLDRTRRASCSTSTVRTAAVLTTKSPQHTT